MWNNIVWAYFWVGVAIFVSVGVCLMLILCGIKNHIHPVANTSNGASVYGTTNAAKYIANFNDFEDKVIIDGCEYGVCGSQNALVYVHKGNCTNCWARMERLLKPTNLEKP